MADEIRVEAFTGFALKYKEYAYTPFGRHYRFRPENGRRLENRFGRLTEKAWIQTKTIEARKQASMEEQGFEQKPLSRKLYGFRIKGMIGIILGRFNRYGSHGSN